MLKIVPILSLLLTGIFLGVTLQALVINTLSFALKIDSLTLASLGSFLMLPLSYKLRH